ncbi:MAG: endonuclease III [Rickettsiales bacterium]|nr:endonuclease III [Rickettsiales bacterium]
MKKSQISKVFEVFKKQNPAPKTELNFINDYTLLVAIALSAQTTDIAVNKATDRLFQKVKTPQEMVKLGEEKLKSYIKNIGLYNAKAKNVIKLSQTLVKEYNSKVPRDFDSLKSLAGVGTKTANVFLNCFYNEPVIAVDTHVFRVANRIGFVQTKNADETAEKLNKIIPQDYKLYAHHWLILHGRYVCKARKPECKKCLINNLCSFKEKTL